MNREKISFTKKDFKVDWFSGQGAGGQHRNKHQNCCRITHISSRLTATSQNSRSRTENQRDAFTRLAGKIVAYYGFNDPATERNHSDSVVRTYHFERNVATDGEISAPVQSTVDGDIDRFIENALVGKRPQRKSGRA